MKQRRSAFAWQPESDTLIALATLLAFSLCYYAGTTINSLFLWLGILVFGTLIPLWTVLHRRRETIAGVGITRKFLLASLVISLVLGAGSAYQLVTLANASGADIASHLAANFLVLWEPFFVFGWLYLRWERAFGWLPAIALTGLGFMVQHLGSVPAAAAAGFGVFAIMFAIAFALVRNLAVLWPLFYPVASGIGTLQAGFAMGWSDAGISAIVLVLQLMIFWWLAKKAKSLPAA
ncbi:hypothetical protein [Glutamicibacter sp.]|uniref:hypothetical protein n=1 Tax=Glutamicibacter sp. TaxID=1931995 RepID=UPI003D6BF75A